MRLERTAYLQHDRGRGIDFVAREQRTLWQDQVHTGRLHSVDAADGSGEFAFKRPQMVDVLDKGRCAKRVGLVKNFVADTAALGQPGLGEFHAQPGDLVLGHHDNRAVALELIGDRLSLQVLDDRGAVLDG